MSADVGVKTSASVRNEGLTNGAVRARLLTPVWLWCGVVEVTLVCGGTGSWDMTGVLVSQADGLLNAAVGYPVL